jgi:hypothetical protein
VACLWGGRKAAGTECCANTGKLPGAHPAGVQPAPALGGAATKKTYAGRQAKIHFRASLLIYFLQSALLLYQLPQTSLSVIFWQQKPFSKKNEYLFIERRMAYIHITFEKKDQFFKRGILHKLHKEL